MSVLLLDTWPGSAELSWLVKARAVLTGEYASKRQAVAAIASWAGETSRWVLDNPYTAKKRDDAGVVIAWRATPVQRLDIVKPVGLEVGRNGWLVTDDASLLRLGIDVEALSVPQGRRTTSGRKPRRAQGRRPDVVLRKAIEDHAVMVAKRWCRGQGWTKIRDTGLKHSWDLEATDTSGSIRRVEVKGTTGERLVVEVTAGEVRAAGRHGASHSIVIVTHIELALDGFGAPRATGGIVHAFDPWCPLEAELRDLRYSWVPGPSRVAGT